MKRTILVTLFALVAASGLSSVAAAEATIGAVFTKNEVSIIAAWYRDHGSSARQKQHGKKHGGLPPGIAKNLQRGKRLPPGIAKQYLPDGLIHLLPSPRRGFERIVVDGKVLLVEIATQVVHDVLADVILG